MTVVGLDDTDSRERGMCTTYVAGAIADRLAETGRVERLLLVRLNPAVKYKTRGNAALAIHTDVGADDAFAAAKDVLESLAETADDRTNPGLVVADHGPEAVPEAVESFARDAIGNHLEIEAAESAIERAGYRSWGAGNGRGRIGALAAVGSWLAVDDWTYEHIAYRESERWGTERAVDAESVFAAAEATYPDVWDTVDRGEGDVVCVPHTPGPILYGIRGEDPEGVRETASQIESEPVESERLFATNQGTDAHVREDATAPLEDGRAYRIDGRVAAAPETRRGGHVFVELAVDGERLECAAFEPTKRFRDRVRALREGDRVAVCGEVARGTLKLEKFAVRELVTTESASPTCPDCERTMKSAGREQGYRCRDCGTAAADRERIPLERDLEPGWYEVPPCARRHIAKPLVRGGFDAPTHPER